MNQAFLDYYNLQPLWETIHTALCSVMPEGLAIFLECVVVGVVIMVLYAVLAIILIYMERKGCAAFQCRIGPNRVGGKGGLLQVPADVIKILIKEVFKLKRADQFLYALAPFLVILASILTFSCLPWHNGAEILHMIITMGNHMKLSIIAEGVETEQQKVMLQGFGCNKAQGYFYARPMREAEYTELLRKEKAEN